MHFFFKIYMYMWWRKKQCLSLLFSCCFSLFDFLWFSLCFNVKLSQLCFYYVSCLHFCHRFRHNIPVFLPLFEFVFRWSESTRRSQTGVGISIQKMCNFCNTCIKGQFKVHVHWIPSEISQYLFMWSDQFAQLTMYVIVVFAD